MIRLIYRSYTLCVSLYTDMLKHWLLIHWLAYTLTAYTLTAYTLTCLYTVLAYTLTAYALTAYTLTAYTLTAYTLTCLCTDCLYTVLAYTLAAYTMSLLIHWLQKCALSFILAIQHWGVYNGSERPPNCVPTVGSAQRCKISLLCTCSETLALLSWY